MTENSHSSENALVLCSRLLRALKRADPDNPLVQQAERYLARDFVSRVLRVPAQGQGSAQSGTQPAARRSYTVEAHGEGYALYEGRDALHHGLNLAHITETTPAVCALIERALNDFEREEAL